MDILIAVCAALAAVTPSGGGDAAHTAAALAQSVYRAPVVDLPFDFRATVTAVLTNGRHLVALKDATGAVIVRAPDAASASGEASPRAGDVVRVTGTTSRDGYGMTYAQALTTAVVSRGPPPAPMRTTVEDLLSGKADCRLVAVAGMVVDAFRDEIDPNWVYLALRGRRDTAYLTFAADGDEEDASSLIGADVSATGVCTPMEAGERRHLGRLLQVNGIGEIRIMRARGECEFNAPNINDIQSLYAHEIAAFGRCMASGRVLAVWQGKNMLVRAADGRIVRISCLSGPLPAPGDFIEAEGFPETDMYRINMTQATWRRRDCGPGKEEPAVDVSAAELLTDAAGRRRVLSHYHGRLIRIRGTARKLPSSESGASRAYIECDGVFVGVDASEAPGAFDGMESGCVIAATGVCLMEAGNWRSGDAMPRIDSVAVIVRRAGDVEVLSRPPWWTPRRTSVALGTLLAALLGIIIWNRALSRAAERRGHELLRAQIARVGADLRLSERTHLAAELHDSVAQNLSSVSMQIDAAMRLADEQPARMRRCLDLASKTLNSCSDELRACLWDLHSRALEAHSMEEAVRLAVGPSVDAAALDIRFSIPRSRLSDKTAHDILRIARELASNAVRHGGAENVSIRGSLSGGTITMSVSDDGCGFDVDSCPGPSQGHFGLQGIRDRIRCFNGTLTIESAPGRGTTATVTLHATSAA